MSHKGPFLVHYGSLYINDIFTDIDSETRLFADDRVCYREIRDTDDPLKIQKDTYTLGYWARKWGMIFQPVKCKIMQITRKNTNRIEASYTLEGTCVLRQIEHLVS